MPGIAVVSNSQQPLYEILNEELKYADEFRAASAFLNSDGLSHIMPGLRRILEDEGSVYLIHGADFRITDPQAVSDLVDLKMRYGNMSYYVHCDWWLTSRHAFHPKLYMTTSDYRNYCAVVGSSNLTNGGMYKNIEVNTIIRGSRSEEPVIQCLSVFESIMNDKALLQPNWDFAQKYEDLYGSAEGLSIFQDPPYELKDLYLELLSLQSIVKQDWQPRTQVEFIIKAIENLAQGEYQHFHHLSGINKEAEKLVKNAGEEYKWDTFHNSVRGRLNENTVGKSGGALFERRGGVEGRYGQYRLSEKGINYGKSKLEHSGSN